MMTSFPAVFILSYLSKSKTDLGKKLSHYQKCKVVQNAVCISEESAAVSAASSVVYTGFKEGAESSSRGTSLSFQHSKGPWHIKIK